MPLPTGEPRIRLRAVAYDTAGLRSRPAELLLLRPTAAAASGNLHALSVGVTTYRNLAWNTLQYADADALAFAAAISRGATGGEQPQTTVLVNEQATIQNLKFALRELKDLVTEDDVAVTFVAGHGLVGPDGGYYFLCHDSQEGDLAGTALPWEDFVSLLREVRAKRIMLFADTCHAGFITGAGDTGRLADRLNRQAGVMVFAAGGGDEASVERAEWGHGAFTQALLEALGGKADTSPQDGGITLSELKDYTVARVARLTEGQQHAYLPRLQEFEPEWVLLRP